MSVAVCVVCAVLMVFGVTELVRVVAFWWRKPETARPFSIVVEPKGPQDCEAAVRAVAERVRWLDLAGPCRILCVDRQGDPELEKICRFLALQYPYLQVCKREDLVYHILDENWAGPP